MKTKITLIALMIIGLIGTQGFTAEQKKNENGQVAAAADILADGQPVQIRGVLEKTESGLFLLDGKQAFLLKGDKELDKLIGKPVDVQGIFKKGEKNLIILVNQAKVLQ